MGQQRLEQKALALLLHNRRTAQTDGHTHTFTCPSPQIYPWQWLWDSCFHAWVLRWLDPRQAQGELLSLLSAQWPDGRVPNMAHIGFTWRFDRLIHGTGTNTSGITQPPLIAPAAMAVYAANPDPSFLREVFAPLNRFDHWLRTHREVDRDGLIYIWHPWESGIDNSPRWDTVFGIKRFNRRVYDLQKGALMMRFNLLGYDNHTMAKASFFKVKAVDMNCYYHAHLSAMAEMSQVLGEKALARQYHHRAEKTGGAIRRILKKPGSGFRCRHYPGGAFLDVATPFAFLPLWAGLLDKTEAAAVVQELTDTSRFWPDYPVPTTAMDEPAFDPTGYWRGTVWMNINWMLTGGLWRYGYKDFARELAAKSVALVQKSGLREYYNPLTGEGLGAEDFGWSTLVVDMQREGWVS